MLEEMIHEEYLNSLQIPASAMEIKLMRPCTFRPFRYDPTSRTAGSLPGTVSDLERFKGKGMT